MSTSKRLEFERNQRKHGYGFTQTDVQRIVDQYSNSLAGSYLPAFDETILDMKPNELLDRTYVELCHYLEYGYFNDPIRKQFQEAANQKLGIKDE